MLSISLLGLTSISQWVLFLGIGLIVFGWIEKKEKFILGGQLIFTALGILSLYVLATNDLNITQIEGTLISKEAKMLAFFRGVAYFFVLAVVSLAMKLFRIRYQNISVYALVFFALMLFFMVFNVLQTSN